MARARRGYVKLPPPGPDDPVSEWYHSRGLRAPKDSVWLNGEDITETVPPEDWPWPWTMYYASGWRPWGWD